MSFHYMFFKKGVQHDMNTTNEVKVEKKEKCQGRAVTI